MGFLIERELEFLQAKLESPESPFLVIMGGAKVSDKIEVITSLMDKADQFIIGGAMAYTFAKAQGYEIGTSMVEEDKLDLALSILKLAKEKGTEFLLPSDSVVSQEFKDGSETRIAGTEAGIEAGWMGLDIGDAPRHPKTIAAMRHDLMVLCFIQSLPQNAPAQGLAASH